MNKTFSGSGMDLRNGDWVSNTDTTTRDDVAERSRRSELEPQAGGSESTYRSVAELAAELNLSERSTRAALRRGEIPHIRVGRRFILPRVAIAEWLRTAGAALQTEIAPPADPRREPLAGAGHAEVTVMRRAAG